MKIAAPLILALLASTASAQSVSIPSPQVEIDFAASVTDNFGFHNTRGNVRTTLDTGFNTDLGDFRLETRIQRLSDSDYTAVIRLFKGDGPNWRELGDQPVTLGGRFGAELDETIQYSDATLNLTMTVSQQTLNIRVGEPREPDSGIGFLVGALALLLLLALIVLYLKRS